MLFTKFDAMRHSFSKRLRADAITLETWRAAVTSQPPSARVLERLQCCAHKLAGAAEHCGFWSVSSAASKLEHSVIELRHGSGTSGELQADLNALLVCIDRE
jgi:hypothetical protein